MNENNESPEGVHFRDIAPAIEFVCWVFVLLAIILRIVNGAAVTSDQFVFQVALSSLALIVGIGLRIHSFLSRQ